MSVLCALFVGAALGVTYASLDRPDTRSAESLYPLVRSSVVDLRVGAAHGTGLVIAPDQVLTARHLVVGNRDVRVHSPSFGARRATLLGTDARVDLALLQLDEPLPDSHPIEPADVAVGQSVVAVGNPFGLGQSVAVGAVAGVDRRLAPGTGMPVGFIQLAMPLHPGNSGGPIFDLDGHVVGLLTGTHTEGQSIGFAVPARAVVNALPALREGTHVSRAFLGLRVENSEHGLRVRSVIPTGPADAAGIRVGDHLTGLDATELTDEVSLDRALDDLRGGQTVTFRLRRDDRLELAQVELADWAQQPVVIAGMTLRPAPGSGGRVVALRPRSRSDQAGVRIGDLIQTVDGLPVQAPADVRATLGGRDQAVLGVERAGQGVRVRL